LVRDLERFLYFFSVFHRLRPLISVMNQIRYPLSTCFLLQRQFLSAYPPKDLS
jgi:hypothetical protein